MAAATMATAQVQVAARLSHLSLDSAHGTSERATCSARLAPTLRQGALSSGKASCQLSGFGTALAGTPIQIRQYSEKKVRSTVVQAALEPMVWDDDDDDLGMTEEEVQAAYEALYGKAFGGEASPVSIDISKADEDDVKPAGRARRGRGRGSEENDDNDSRSFEGRRGKDEFEERLIQVRRVTKVVKGGKQMAFRTVVVVGDKKGRVGVGVGKAKEVVVAVQKAGVDARRHLVKVPMTKNRTFPHRTEGHFGAATIMLRPAAVGTGVIAGGACRVVLELAGIENALGKELGSGNPLNNARAVLDAVSNMKQFKDVAQMRGIPVEELWK